MERLQLNLFDFLTNLSLKFFSGLFAPFSAFSNMPFVFISKSCDWQLFVLRGVLVIGISVAELVTNFSFFFQVSFLTFHVIFPLLLFQNV